MTVGYALGEIRDHWNEPEWWRKRFLTHVVSRYYRWRGPESEPLVEQDWDAVLLLDACRYDLFAEALNHHPLPGELSKRISAETGTPGYLAENFAGGQFHDIVYVTANPYVQTELPEDTFHAVDHVWKDAWDEDEQTLMPDVMADRALAAAERYPDKRLLVHFNQPHAPFVGEKRLGDRRVNAIRETALGNDVDTANRLRTPFELLDAGEVSREEVWEAYLSNLELAFPAVERLLNELEGLIAVTSDHGNALGERATPCPMRVYGHPLGVHIPALTEVPWFTYQNGPRKTIRAEKPSAATDDGPDDEVNQRLRDLGYAE